MSCLNPEVPSSNYWFIIFDDQKTKKTFKWFNDFQQLCKKCSTLPFTRGEKAIQKGLSSDAAKARRPTTIAYKSRPIFIHGFRWQDAKIRFLVLSINHLHSMLFNSFWSSKSLCHEFNIKLWSGARATEKINNSSTLAGWGKAPKKKITPATASSNLRTCIQQFLLCSNRLNSDSSLAAPQHPYLSKLHPDSGAGSQNLQRWPSAKPRDLCCMKAYAMLT